MKKIFYLFLLPILLVGCSKETEKLSEPSPVGGMISVHSQREFSDGPQRRLHPCCRRCGLGLHFRSVDTGCKPTLRIA